MSLGSSRASYAKMSSDKEQDGISPVGALGKKGGRAGSPGLPQAAAGRARLGGVSPGHYRMWGSLFAAANGHC